MQTIRRHTSLGLATITATLALTGIAAAQGYSPGARYDNPAHEAVVLARQRGPCGDPWVSMALVKVHGMAEPARCSIALYNGGKWNDFNQLVHAVAAKRGTASLAAAAAKAQQPTLVPMTPNGKAGLIGTGSAGLVGNDGGSLVGNDGAGLRKK